MSGDWGCGRVEACRCARDGDKNFETLQSGLPEVGQVSDLLSETAQRNVMAIDLAGKRSVRPTRGFFALLSGQDFKSQEFDDVAARLSQSFGWDESGMESIARSAWVELIALRADDAGAPTVLGALRFDPIPCCK